MPRQAKELSALEVKRLSHAGGKSNVTFAVGGVSGLLLQVTPKGGRTWLLRTQCGDKRREIGLGGFPDVPLSLARERAREAKEEIRRGIDPVETKKAAKAALVTSQRNELTFSAAMEKYLDAKMEAFQNSKHRAQWRSTLETYAKPTLGNLPVSIINVRDVLSVLEPLWSSKTETASRLRGRIEAVLSWATVAGHRAGDNPARWAGNLKELLPAPAKIGTRENQPALSLAEVAHWFSALKTREGMSARALEFLALTALPSGPIRGTRWSEIDFKTAMWIIPAQRMKSKRELRVPLSPAAINLLRGLPKVAGSDLVFPAPRGEELGDMSLSAVMRRMQVAEQARLNEADRKAGKEVPAGLRGFLDSQTKRPAVPHGLRSTFRDWVAERTTYPGEMAEVALAHKISNAVEAAYRRGDMLEKRRGMMTAWADFIAGVEPAQNVVRIG